MNLLRGANCAITHPHKLMEETPQNYKQNGKKSPQNYKHKV
jgi:hypothetical protein